MPRAVLDMLVPLLVGVVPAVRTALRIVLVLSVSWLALSFMDGCAHRVDRDSPHVEPRKVRLRDQWSGDYIDAYMRWLLARAQNCH